MPAPATETDQQIAEVMKLWSAGHDTREISIRLNTPEWLVFGLLQSGLAAKRADARQHLQKSGQR
jgi:hypothetical protein